MRGHRWFLGLLVLSCMWTLSACMPFLSADTRLDLKNDEAWEMEIVLLMPGQEAMLYIPQIQAYLDQQFSTFRAQGGQVETRQLNRDENGNLPYEIRLRGKSYALLNNTIFNSQTIITELPENHTVHFLMSSYNNPFSSAESTNFTLRGGKIISTNGRQLDNTTVIWENPMGDMEAVMDRPAPDYVNYLLWVMGALLALGAVGLVVGLIRRRRIAAVEAYRSPAIPVERSCGACGRSLPPDAKFCPFCGNVNF